MPPFADNTSILDTERLVNFAPRKSEQPALLDWSFITLDGVPAIGLDLDGCIDEAPHFFAPFSHLWPASVYVITFRRDYEKARLYVESFGIRYSEIILVERFEDKAIVIKDKSIGIYFDDQDEMLMHIPDDVVVLKIRNGGNFDSRSRQWLYSKVTGREI